MIHYLQHLLLQCRISSAQSFCCSYGAYASKGGHDFKTHPSKIQKRFGTTTSCLVNISLQQIFQLLLGWSYSGWCHPGMLGNGNEIFFAHLSTWLKSTHPHSLRDSLFRNWWQVILGCFREPHKVARFCPVRAYKAAITSFLHSYLPI